MNPTKREINVVWLKRDLRLHDNEAIFNAVQSGKPILLLYVLEKSLYNDPHYSERHWNFIKESLVDINNELIPLDTKVVVAFSEIISVLNFLQEKYCVHTVYSHQETGLKITYDRDKSFKRYCQNHRINWIENINNGIFRGLENRTNWTEKWENYMNAPQFVFSGKTDNFIRYEELVALEKQIEVIDLATPNNPFFQRGGTKMGEKYMKSFFEDRYHQYNYSISKPLLARKSCSRLSPYIAWGNLSIRQIIQKAVNFQLICTDKKQISSFISRLTWQAHFIQKFEMEETMEFVSVNKGYHLLKKKINETHIEAWKKGQTGFPLIDACMRCLNETGYLNFRMRAMVVSFFTHNLWQPWQEATQHLSRQFLDFEPGIHFPQLQMQAGETGINLLRIYNPIKNSYEHDPNGEFIKKWVPELQNIPTEFIHEPYKLTYLDQQFNNFELGKDYPKPIIDINKTRKYATDILWKMKKNAIVKEENKRILQLHTLSNIGDSDS
jgi:deoxyribodipyrimidine photo-lyase